jgi:RecA-family ATPase
MDSTTPAPIQLPPDRGMLTQFSAAMFKHAGTEGFVSLRAFYEDDASKPFRITPISMKGGLPFLVDAVADDAYRAANHPRKIVFCPPIAVFGNNKNAQEGNILEGLALSVECDQRAREARETLEEILGPATLVVRSGGEWTDPETGQIFDKLHLHWRLAAPAHGADLASLKQARNLAARLVGGDPSNKPVCHPIRWPGSWHRKGEPRLCEIEIATENEIDLGTALAALEKAAPAATKTAPAATNKANGATPAPGGSDWAELLADIATGTGYHDAIVRLAAKLLAAGMADGAAVNLIRAELRRSGEPHDARWQARYDDVPRAVTTARGKFGGEVHTGATASTPSDNVLPQPLPWLDMSNWDNEPVPEQDWAVRDRIPLRQCVLYSGEGATGKSIELQHLCAAHALARDWLGSMPEPGPAFYIEAEDEASVIHRRTAAILAHYGATFADAIAGGLNLMSLAGQDAVLATVARNGRIEPTTFYTQLLEAAGDLKPKMIGIASSANVYAGSEIDRAQVQQFVGLLTRVAIVANGAVVLASHPSLTGITSDSGISGTTQWHNAVRARFYMKGIKPEAGEQPDNDLREIVFKKNQYGPVSASIIVRYQNGIFLPVPGMASLEKVARDAKAEEIFLDLLQRFTSDNRRVSDRKSPTYAPALFARENIAVKAGITSNDFAAAMRRLFEAKKIWNEPYGKPSRPSFHLARRDQ